MGKGGRSKNRSRGGRKTFKKMDVIILRKEKKIRKDWVKGLKKIPCEYIRRNAHLKIWRPVAPYSSQVKKKPFRLPRNPVPTGQKPYQLPEYLRKQKRVLHRAELAQAHFLDRYLDVNLVKELGQLMREHKDEMFPVMNDRRHTKKKKRGFQMGNYFQVGHQTKGKLEDYCPLKKGSPLYNKIRHLLQQLANKACEAVKKHRPDLWNLVGENFDVEDLLTFKLFNQFMAVQGSTLSHVDNSNAFVFLFPISGEGGDGGVQLLGGKKAYGCRYYPGDAVLFDASKIPHGTGPYRGKEEERLVGMFIFHYRFAAYYKKSTELKESKLYYASEIPSTTYKEN